MASIIAVGMAPRGLGVLRAAVSSYLGQPVTLRDHDFWRAFLGGSAWGNKRVTVDAALQLATVWACVRLIAETLATLPVGLYRRKTDGSSSSATDHPLWDLLHNQPNGDMTAVVFWQLVVACMLLWGNAYVEIARNSAGRIVALNVLLPERVRWRVLTGGAMEFYYRDRADSLERTIAEADMMHIPAFTLDGRIGVSPIVYGANVFGTSISTDKTSAETFNNGLKSPGVVTMDMVFKKGQRDEIREHVKETSAKGGVMVLEKGATFQSIGFDPVSAELLASRSWNVEEMCRWFHVDPAMIGHGGKDSNWGTGLEQKMIWFVTFTLRNWAVRIEQAMRKALLTPVERQSLFARFTLEGLLRADSAARAAFYSIMTQNGVMTRDECRMLENLAPMGGNAGVLTVQVNMLPIDKLGEQTTSAPGDKVAQAMAALLAPYQSMKGNES